MRERRGVCRFMVGNPEENKPIGRLRRRWENNTRRNLQEMGCRGKDWINLA